MRFEVRWVIIWIFIFVFVNIKSVYSSDNKSVMTYVYNAPESNSDVRYAYQWEILRTALDKTRDKYGDYKMVRSKTMSEKRQTFELRKETGEITVMYLGSDPDLEKELLAIHIPVDKNLGGYSIFLIRKERKNDFVRVKTLDDLRKFSIGLGLGWLDVEILRHNNFRVVTCSSYD